MPTEIIVKITHARHKLMKIPAAAKLHRHAMERRGDVRAWARRSGSLEPQEIADLKVHKHASSAILFSFQRLCTNLRTTGTYDTNQIGIAFLGLDSYFNSSNRPYCEQNCMGALVPRAVLTTKLVGAICSRIPFPEHLDITHALVAAICRNVLKNSVLDYEEEKAYEPDKTSGQRMLIGRRQMLPASVFTEVGFDTVIVGILSPVYGIGLSSHKKQSTRSPLTLRSFCSATQFG